MKNNSIIKKFFGFSIGPILSAIVSFISVPITTYLISPEEFGKASFFTVSISLLLSVIYLGIDQSFAREYFNVKDKRILYFNAIVLPFVVTSFISIIILIFPNQFLIYLFGSTEYKFVPLMFCAILFLSIIERFTLMSYRMEERAVLYSIFSVLTKFFTLIFTMYLLLFVNKSFVSIIYATFIGQLIASVLLVLCSYQYIFINIKYFDLKIIKSLLKFGIPMLVSALVATFLNSGGQFFLRYYGNFEDVGVYAAALKIIAIINIVQGSFTSFWIPLAYRWNNEKTEIKYFKRISDILTVVLSLLFILILIFKNYLILVLSPEYAKGAEIVGLLALTPILYTLSEATTLGIVFSGKSYFSFISSIIALLVNLAINILMVPYYGVYAAAFAQATAYIVFYFSKIIFSKKENFYVVDYKNLFTIFVLFFLAIVNIANDIIVTIVNVSFLLLVLFLYRSIIVGILKKNLMS